MRLIDADALKADYGMADECKDCKTNVRTCEYDRVYTKMDFCVWLDDAPTVPQWIPCSERLPEPDDKTCYLVSQKDYNWLVIARYATFGKKNLWDDDEGLVINEHVTAYMPLPEPYMEGEE